MPDQSALGVDRLKHLEFIQAVITRLGTCSFLIKGWTLTVAAAFFAVLATRLTWAIAGAGLIPLLAFWALDGYFLRQERLFRRLYDDARRVDSTVEPMSMSTAAYHAGTTWARVALSPTLAVFYGALVLVHLALAMAAIAVA